MANQKDGVRVSSGCCVIARARSQHLCTEMRSAPEGAPLTSTCRTLLLRSALLTLRSARYHGHAAAIIAGRDPQLHSPWLDLNRPPGSQGDPNQKGSALHTLVPVVRG